MSIWKILFCSCEETESVLSFLKNVMIVVLLLLHHDPPTCDAISNNQTHCKPSSCGKISKIKYPFRLMNDPTTCGDPSYELSCENNRTVLTLFSGKYYVQEINYKNYTIRLVDPGIEESDCSSTPQYFLTGSNFSANSLEEEWVPYGVYYRLGYENIIYLNCSKAVKDDPWYVDTSPCINRDSNSYLYAFANTYREDDVSNIFYVGRLKDYCRVKVVAISSSNLPNRPLSYQQIHGVLVYGFQLSWITSPCRDTCGDKLSCYFNQTSRDLECSKPYYDCQYPFGDYVNCTQISKPLVLLEDVLLGIAKGVLQIFGILKSSHSKPENIDFKISIELGRVTGRYILPFFGPRYEYLNAK
ncbi:unnamed protein product [Vicia faba]|uniref:Wall-associated receptor kinase galacturonan-binding domain-containing protein n=1 Tax=Vicia faba TaxID=3906 RepID=A0AAV1A6E4_VICFA|nr:unnamed protein product [Vicia faba]